MSLSDLRIVFAGTPEFAAPSLAALLQHQCQVVAVFTQPDRPAGRGRQLTPSPVKQFSLKHNIPVWQPEKLNGKAIEILEKLQPDVMIVAAYGLLLPEKVLNLPTHGCLNVHASLLPRWRGAAPIQKAILEGDTETGVTIMQMDKGLDTGDMLHKMHCSIGNKETGQTLHDKLAQLGAEALIITLTQLTENQINFEPQSNDQATYAGKIVKADAKINWQQSAQNIERMIRAFNPWPIAFTFCKENLIRIWGADVIESSNKQLPGTIVEINENGIHVACGNHTSLQITNIQLSGKKPASAYAVYQGHQELFSPHSILGSEHD